MPLLLEMTPEERQALLLKAREARIRKQQERKQSTLRRDFLSYSLWVELASARKLNLPPWGEPVRPTGMRRWLNKLGISATAYLSWAGEADLKQFAQNNPDWPLRAWAGLVLEHLDQLAP
jgi:hypothetical protein